MYESSTPADPENRTNVVVFPATGDIFLQEDGDDERFVRGVTRPGRIYDFARTLVNQWTFVVIGATVTRLRCGRTSSRVST